MHNIPFLKPNLVKKDAYLSYLEGIDERRVYSNFGPLTTMFEEKILKKYFSGKGFITTINNATTGLILAISTLKRKKGKYALMPSFTFPATPLAARWAGLEPYFVDIDRSHWCMHQELLDGLIHKLGDDVGVVVPYATFGYPLDLTYLSSLHEQGIPVVVDAAASFGSSIDGGQFGADFPGAVVFSLHATKSFGIGEGGLVYSVDADTIHRIRQASNFGFDSDRSSLFLGLNGKMPEVMAAIGLSTLDVYSQKKQTRQTIFEWYVQGFKDLGLLDSGWQFQDLVGSVSHQFTPVLCPVGHSNQKYVERLSEQGVQLRTYFSPACHEQNLFLDCPKTGLSTTENVTRRILSLPLWEEMLPEQVIQVLENLASLSNSFV